MLAEIKARLTRFGVEFDVVLQRADLHEGGALEQAIGPAARAGPRLRGRGRGLAADHRLRRRQGPGAVAVQRRDGPTSPPTAPTTSTSASAASTGASIMLGADHHGYVGRMRAMAACSGDDPDLNLEILIGQLVNLVRNGEPVRMSQARRHRGHPGGPGRRGRRGRRPLRAGPLLQRLADRPSTSSCAPGPPATTRSTTSSTSHARTASVARNAAELGVTGARRRFRPGAARPREGGRAAQGDRRVPVSGGHRRRAA